jgi:hypothetical protein
MASKRKISDVTWQTTSTGDYQGIRPTNSPLPMASSETSNHTGCQYPFKPKSASEKAFRTGQLLDRGFPRAQARPAPADSSQPHWIDWARKPGNHGTDAEYDTSWTDEKIAQYKIEQEHGGWINFSEQALNADIWADYQVWHYNRLRRQSDNWWPAYPDTTDSAWHPAVATSNRWDPTTTDETTPVPADHSDTHSQPHGLHQEEPTWIEGTEHRMTKHGMVSAARPLDHSQSVVWNGMQHVVTPEYVFPTNQLSTTDAQPAFPVDEATPAKNTSEFLV